MPEVVIVGAGITGLTCAAELRGHAGVTVVERVPVTGGVHGWEATETREQTAASGARLLLGATAVRWDGERLLAMDQDGAHLLPASVLVIATGTRPLGRAELGIAGPRPAGIVAATVAVHLAENGLLVGRRPLVMGGGDWAHRAANELLEAGAERVTMACPDGVLAGYAEQGEDLDHLRKIHGARPVRVGGQPRVQYVELSNGDVQACDALVLAHGVVPLRNVDGAVWDGPRTVYAQPAADPATVAGARTAGSEAARAVRSLLESA
ncbi:MAG TPA: FAD-dependent oxidoreductase [Gaiellales bacterium]|nr:FAD-dependent oxidoreductase [Gaiellales bacterium]